MIDIHSHVLPEVDDGSKSMEMTLEMLRKSESEGTNIVIATPHFCRGYAEVELSQIKNVCKEVQERSKSEGIKVELYHGQEVFYSESMIEDYKDGIIGTLADSQYLLFELPLQGDIEQELFEDLYEMKLMGITPVLAHPERYKYIKNNPSIINRFIEEEILFQVNSGSITGIFGKETKKVADMFLERGIYNFIGSDGHNTSSRQMGIKEGLNISINKNAIYKNLFDKSAESLIRNEDIKFYGEKVKKRRIFKFF